MVNSVSNFTSQSFAQAQKNSDAKSSTALKSNKAAKEAIMQQLEETATQGKNLMQHASSANALNATPAPDSNLPRGSLIDIIV